MGRLTPTIHHEDAEAIILATVRRVPSGWVATYGQIAAMAGLGRRSRMVGHVLQQLDARQTGIPWHRIVNAKGEISYSMSRGGSDVTQRRLLEAEGVEFDAKERIDMARFGWVE